MHIFCASPESLFGNAYIIRVTRKRSPSVTVFFFGLLRKISPRRLSALIIYQAVLWPELDIGSVRH